MKINFLKISDDIKKEIKLSFYGATINTSPLSEGFVMVKYVNDNQSEIYFTIIKQSIKHNKTTIILNPNFDCLIYLNSLIKEEISLNVIVVIGNKPIKMPKNEVFTQADEKIIDCIFLITENYLIRRFFIYEITKSNFSFKGQEKLRIQSIKCIGLPP